MSVIILNLSNGWSSRRLQMCVRFWKLSKKRKNAIDKKIMNLKRKNQPVFWLLELRLQVFQQLDIFLVVDIKFQDFSLLFELLD